MKRSRSVSERTCFAGISGSTWNLCRTKHIRQGERFCSLHDMFHVEHSDQNTGVVAQVRAATPALLNRG